MKSESKNIHLSRKKFLGIGLALPFLSVPGSLLAKSEKQKEDDEYITMLTAEGKAVKVKKNALANAKVIDKKMSNQSLLSWLKPKGFTK
ncbi:MAG: hypothetical protein HOP30_02265 [Cyclobacteriaceae bacterium]|nr:hypothetical protein [Cyclobacteriaceae bacterium]